MCCTALFRDSSRCHHLYTVSAGVWDGVLEDINCHLPADIRVCGMRRVPPRFNAQLLCDDRLYSYTLPTFAFTPMEQVRAAR